MESEIRRVGPGRDGRRKEDSPERIDVTCGSERQVVVFLVSWFETAHYFR